VFEGRRREEHVDGELRMSDHRRAPSFRDRGIDR